MKMAKYLIAAMLVLVIAGCGGETPARELYPRPQPAKAHQPEHNATELYLFPAVTGEDTTQYINETRYKIFRNGDYLGDFASHRKKPVEINKSTVNETNGTITFVPGDELELYVYVPNQSASEEYVRPHYHEMTVPDRPFVRYVPEMKVVYPEDFHYMGSENRRYRFLPDINWTFRLSPYRVHPEIVTLQAVDLKEKPYHYLCCYPRSKVVDIRLNGNDAELPKHHLDEECVDTPDIYDDPEITMDIKLQAQTNGTITCRYMDRQWHISGEADIRKQTKTWSREDIGIPDRVFNITVVAKDT